MPEQPETISESLAACEDQDCADEILEEIADQYEEDK